MAGIVSLQRSQPITLNQQTVVADAPDLSGYALTSSLAAVATSGAYADLSGAPDLSGYLTGATDATLTATDTWKRAALTTW